MSLEAITSASHRPSVNAINVSMKPSWKDQRDIGHTCVNSLLSDRVAQISLFDACACLMLSHHPLGCCLIRALVSSAVYVAVKTRQKKPQPMPTTRDAQFRKRWLSMPPKKSVPAP